MSRGGAAVAALSLIMAAAGPSAPAAGQEELPPPATDQWLTTPVDPGSVRSFLQFFSHDPALPYELESLGTGEFRGLSLETLRFRSTPGEWVTADLYRAAGEWRDRPTLILLHGGSGDGRQSGGARFGAGLFSRAGWNVLALDFMHFGDRRSGVLTSFSESEKHDRLYNNESAYLEWVTQTVKDVRRAFDLLVRHFELDPARIGLVGLSRGAVVAPIVAVAEPRLAAVVMLLGGHFDRRELGHAAAACPANYIGRIAPRPLLMVNGRFDGDMLAETSVAPLYALAGEPKRILWMDTGHQAPPPEVQAEVIAWLRDAMK